MPPRLIHAHCLDVLPQVPELDLIATDPPYAFGGSGDEHALSATVAVACESTPRSSAAGAGCW